MGTPAFLCRTSMETLFSPPQKRDSVHRCKATLARPKRIYIGKVRKIGETGRAALPFLPMPDSTYLG